MRFISTLFIISTLTLLTIGSPAPDYAPAAHGATYKPPLGPSDHDGDSDEEADQDGDDNQLGESQPTPSSYGAPPASQSPEDEDSYDNPPAPQTPAGSRQGKGRRRRHHRHHRHHHRHHRGGNPRRPGYGDDQDQDQDPMDDLDQDPMGGDGRGEDSGRLWNGHGGQGVRTDSDEKKN